jgi:hypothetical protein
MSSDAPQTVQSFARDVAGIHAAVLEVSVELLIATPKGQMRETIETLRAAEADGYAMDGTKPRRAWMSVVLNGACLDILCRNTPRSARSPLTIELPSLLGTIKETRQ